MMNCESFGDSGRIVNRDHNEQMLGDAELVVISRWSKYPSGHGVRSDLAGAVR